MNTRRPVIGLATALLLIGGVIGCDSDEFDDAQYVQASDDGESGAEPTADRAGSGAAPEQQPAQEGRAMDSPGPVQGSERPDDHPTLQDQGGSPDGARGTGDAPAPRVDRPAPDQYGEQGPVRWAAPSEWQPRRPANDMRYAEYEIPAAGGGEPAELTVFYFGERGGGGVDDNLQRWAGEFSDGSEPVRDQLEVDGMAVHTLRVDGTRQASMPMAGGGEPREAQKLLGAVAETSEGLFFFRLVGDRETVAPQSEAFDEFVRSFRDQG